MHSTIIWKLTEFIQISSGNKWLTKSGNQFESGSHDTFTISCPELGI